MWPMEALANSFIKCSGGQIYIFDGVGAEAGNAVGARGME